MSTILGIPFSDKTMQETASFLDTILDERTKAFHVVTANPEIVMMAKRDRKLRMIMKSADMVTADGIGIVIGSKILKEQVPERVAGYDLIHSLLQKREEEQKVTRIFLFGAKEDVIHRAVSQVTETYSHVEIAGYHHGYVTEDSEEEQRVIQSMKESRADLVLVGLGCPRQEKFIYTHKEEIGANVYIGCGGTFDVLAGHVKRAPEFVQKVHGEWLWRLVKKPKRFKRQLDIPRFLIEVVRDKRKK